MSVPGGKPQRVSPKRILQRWATQDRVERAMPHTGAVNALSHVRWIGGGSGAGKTTLARRLAERFGLRRYSTDAEIREHSRRLSRAEAPLLGGFGSMSMDERWLQREPASMYR